MWEYTKGSQRSKIEIPTHIEEYFRLTLSKMSILTDLGYSNPETHKFRSLIRNIRHGAIPKNLEELKFLSTTLQNFCPKSRIDVKDLSSIVKNKVFWEGGVESDLYNFLSVNTETEGS